jgi:hypothetical protein
MTQILKPGFLVSLKTSVSGGIFYRRTDLDKGTDESAAEYAKWETTRRIDDPEEYTRAQKTRSAASALIRAVCAHTAFGLLCPEVREDQLNEAIVQAQVLIDAHNKTAHATFIRVYVLRGKIASSDEEAVRALSSEVRELLEEMQSGIRSLDVKAIRDAAQKARKLGQVLEGEQAKKVSDAVEAARDAAKQIVKRLDTDGTEATRAVAEAMSGPIERARFSFLELEGELGRGPEGEAAPPINLQRMADLEVQ